MAKKTLWNRDGYEPDVFEIRKDRSEKEANDAEYLRRLIDQISSTEQVIGTRAWNGVKLINV
jgi:hypothetical protein